jgi:hypothetical protein
MYTCAKNLGKVCPVCGFYSYPYISLIHIESHNLTYDEFKERYGDVVTAQSANTKNWKYIKHPKVNKYVITKNGNVITETFSDIIKRIHKDYTGVKKMIDKYGIYEKDGYTITMNNIGGVIDVKI